MKNIGWPRLLDTDITRVRNLGDYVAGYRAALKKVADKEKAGSGVNSFLAAYDPDNKLTPEEKEFVRQLWLAIRQTNLADRMKKL